MKKPKQLKPSEINFDSLKEICQNYIDYVDSDDFHEDNDFAHYISEKAIESVFGLDGFDFINSKIE